MQQVSQYCTALTLESVGSVVWNIALTCWGLRDPVIKASRSSSAIVMVTSPFPSKQNKKIILKSRWDCSVKLQNFLITVQVVDVM